MNKTEFKDKMVTLLTGEQVLSDFGEAVASMVMQNPSVVWAKFVLTDDLPNGNGIRVPKEEFPNIIKSGVHMPVKMVEGSIDNHEGSKPLGVITHLIEQGNQILALAALWHKERPSDVDYIKNRIKDKEPVDVSWEIFYDNAETDEEQGYTNIYGTALGAATVVKDPAYEGRTPVLAVAAKARKWSKAYIDQLPDSSFLYIESDKSTRHFPILDKDGNVDKDRLSVILEEMKESSLSKPILKSIKNAVTLLQTRFEDQANLESINKDAKLVISSLDITEDELDELEKLREKVASLEAKLEKAEGALEEKETALAEKEQTLSEQKEELDELREYKNAIEAEVEKQEKLEALRAKFDEAGIEKDDAYFEENGERFLALDEATLDFMLQEMVSFSSKQDDEEDDDKDGEGKKAKASKVPNFKIEGTDQEINPRELGRFLREKKAK